MGKLEVSARDHVQGEDGAELTLVEYGDFQCPDCGTAYPMVKRLQRHYGERMRFVYRNFPLEEIHPMAEPAAEAAEFAGEQGRFWEMHDAIFEGQRRLTETMLVSTAQKLGLDGGAAQTAIEEQRFGERIEEDVKGGKKAGVHGTPTFFVNGSMYDGPREYEDLVVWIDQS